MESNGTCVLHAVCTWCEFTTKNKNSVRKKIVRERYVFAGPLRSALPPPPRSFLQHGHGVRVALGHLGHVAPGHFVRMAGASMATRRACFGSFGSLFLRGPNDPKPWPRARRSFKALGHLGHFVIVQKSARDAVAARPYSLLRVYPYIKIFYFLN
jgi:hypothetical protein